MKRQALFVLATIGSLLPLSANAFLCNGKDLQCLANWILPFNQASDPNNKYREWSAVEGKVTGSGSKIEIKLRFDGESTNTLGYSPSWYSPQSILFKKFGLEVDVCDPSNTLRFDRIEWDNSLSAANPTRDTSLSDSINKCKNAIGLLIRNAGNIQPYTDYYIRIYLKDPLPEGGIVVTPYLQISADTRLLLYAAGVSGEYLFDGTLLGDYLDKFDFFVVESDNYVTNWKLYYDGREGLCWTSKTGSSPCSYPSQPPASVQTTSAANDPGDRLIGATVLPTAGDPPQQLPDFIVSKLWVEDDNGTKMGTFYPGQHVNLKGKFKNRGNGNSPSAITVKFYLSDGKKEDTNKRTVGTGAIQFYNMGAGKTHTETVGFTIPSTPGIYNFTTCADTGGVVSEKHESNNCSDEFVFEVVRRSPAEVKRFLNSSLSIIND